MESTAVVEEPTEWWAWMRPGLARKGDRLLVSFDNMNNISLAEVTLDLVALGPRRPVRAARACAPRQAPGTRALTPKGLELPVRLWRWP